MIDWTDAALEAAFEKLQVDEQKDEWESYIRAALDAAAELQGLETIGYRASERAFEGGRRVGRAEALEEAARVAESMMLPCDIGGDLILDPCTAETIAVAIRALRAAKP